MKTIKCSTCPMSVCNKPGMIPPFEEDNYTFDMYCAFYMGTDKYLSSAANRTYKGDRPNWCPLDEKGRLEVSPRGPVQNLASAMFIQLGGKWARKARRESPKAGRVELRDTREEDEDSNK